MAAQTHIQASLFGPDAEDLRPEIAKWPSIHLVESDPDVTICYGGDGTLLSAELQWPGIPKVPIRNSRRGNRCIAHPADQVIERLAQGTLTQTEFLKLECQLRRRDHDDPAAVLCAMNEFNLHMGHFNAAVRFKLWVNDEPFEDGSEIIGDGLVVSTPFGSTAYFKQITHGIFHTGLGVAFKYTTAYVNHLVVPQDSVIRAVITRGPTGLAYDNSPEHYDLNEGDELVLSKSADPAILLTWDAMKYPSDKF